MSSINQDTIYVLLNYDFHINIYKLIASIKQYCFAYCSLSQKNEFRLYIIYDNYYGQLFPRTNKDQSYIVTSNYGEISKSIDESLDSFFTDIQKIENSDINNNISKINPIDIILKKIILEVNLKNVIIEKNQKNNFLEQKDKIDINDKIILINDSEKDFDQVNQKYIFLLKKENIKIDILSLNEKNNNKTSKALCLFTNGFFDFVTNDKNNITQILIQEFIPIKFKEAKKFSEDIGFFKYHKLISEDKFKCSECGNIIDVYDGNQNFNYNNYTFLYTKDRNNIICYFCRAKIPSEPSSSISFKK